MEPNIELEQLREEMRVLKENLANTTIINEKLLRKAMRSSSQWLGQFVNAEIITTPIVLLILWAAFALFGMNMWSMIFISILCIPSIIIDKKTMSIPNDKIQSESFVSLALWLEKQKVLRKRQLLVELPLSFGWLGWFLYDYLSCSNKYFHIELSGKGFFIQWLIFFLVFSIIAAIAIAIVYKKAQNTNDKLIAEINAFTDNPDAE